MSDNNSDLAAKLYPNMQALELNDLAGLHSAHETEAPDRPADLAHLNREISALQLAPADARGLVHRMTQYKTGPQDDRTRTNAHAEAERIMSQMYPDWARERAAMVEWLSKKAPGVLHLATTTGAANDVTVLRDLLSAYRRRRD